jgi:hypothetical protein
MFFTYILLMLFRRPFTLLNRRRIVFHPRIAGKTPSVSLQKDLEKSLSNTWSSKLQFTRVEEVLCLGRAIRLTHKRT